MMNYLELIRAKSKEQLPSICDEIRSFLIDSVSKTGGHLGSNLGVVELTVALHYVFNTPNDKLIWDIGHQAYVHKIITGRKDEMHTIRQPNGLSGFCSVFESEFDVFGAGHSSTSISAALGIAVQRDLSDEDFKIISVIGDSSISAGMVYEALNNIKSTVKKNFLIILNDNDMSICPPTGAMYNYLQKISISKPYLDVKDFTKQLIEPFPTIKKAIKAVKNKIKNIVSDNIFEHFGLKYIGPVDGHNVIDLVEVFKTIRDSNLEPCIVHLKTIKGYGYKPAENSKDKLHGVDKFDIETGCGFNKNLGLNFSQVAIKSLIELAINDEKIVTVTAAMLGGTGLREFKEKFPERCFDVAIAEQHAVTFCAGMALNGKLKPFCVMYSTFLQRAYDQIIHDVALQNLPVRFLIDRAGFVGADGPTHHGVFDIAFLCNIPNLVIISPSNWQDLIAAVKTISQIDNQPSAVRYPKINIDIADISKELQDIKPLEIGKSKIIKNGEKIAIFSCGTILEECLKANEILKKNGIQITIIDAIFIKPIDNEMIDEIIKTHNKVITIEEGCSGGYGALVSDYITNKNSEIIIKQMHIADKFAEQNTITELRKINKINSDAIVVKVLSLIENE